MSNPQQQSAQLAAAQKTPALSKDTGVDVSEFASDDDVVPTGSTANRFKTVTGKASRKNPVSDTAGAAGRMQQSLGGRNPKGRVGGNLFSAYRPSGATIKYADNKIGILPRIDTVVREIADHAGLDIDNPDIMNSFLDALVTDVYVNNYSNQRSFEGEIVSGVVELERYHIRDVLIPYVGEHFRRYARAMAPYVVAVLYDNSSYYELLDKRSSELSLNSRHEAAYAFDGADALVSVDRSAAERNAIAKALALSKRSTHMAYDIKDSAASKGYHSVGSSIDAIN